MGRGPLGGCRFAGGSLSEISGRVIHGARFEGRLDGSDTSPFGRHLVGSCARVEAGKGEKEAPREAASGA